MGKQEKKVMKALGIKEGKKDKIVSLELFKHSFFGKTWFMESWFEKLIFVLGFLALLWTLFKLVFLGRW